MAGTKAYYLHGERAAAAGNPFISNILLDSPAKSQRIKPPMTVKALVFKSDDAFSKFIWYRGIVWKAPLPVRSL